MADRARIAKGGEGPRATRPSFAPRSTKTDWHQEWVAGRIPLPFFTARGVRARVDLMLFVVSNDGPIVEQRSIAAEASDLKIVEAYERAYRRLEAIRLPPPNRIRVDDPTLAEILKGAGLSGRPAIVLAPTPEVIETLASLMEFERHGAPAPRTPGADESAT